MLLYMTKRILSILPVSLGVVILVSSMVYIVPGDPVDAILGDYANIEEKRALRAALGLDQPPTKQIFKYVSNAFSGDLGNSYAYSRPVLELITERLPATIELAICSLIIAILIAIPTGVISALYKNTFLDWFSMSLAITGVALPNFWLGPLLVLFFSVHLGWLPVSERNGFSSYILPSITMGTALAAALSRMTRNSVLDNLTEDYVRTAKSKGCTNIRLITNHIMRNASLPLITILGLQFGALLTGAVITEKIFDWPGIGSLLLEAIQTRDYPVIQGCVLVFSGSYLLVNLLTDIIYGIIDPRISIGK